jgi:hypothetical protein
MGQIIILCGPPHAGKSEVARALCDRYDRMAHIDVATLRSFIRMGRFRPWDTSPDGRRQRALLVDLACSIALSFVDGGYGTVVEDVLQPSDLSLYTDRLAKREGLAHAVLLLPPLSDVLDRERQDPSEWHRSGQIEILYAHLEKWDRIHTIRTDITPTDQIADRVMQAVAEGSAALR